MLKFSISDARSWEREASWLFPLHYAELALDKDKISLGLNFEKYVEAEMMGHLFIATARDVVTDRLVGYYVAALLPHLHYKDAGRMASTDMYFLHKDYRVGGNGAKMLMFVEDILRRIGITKMYISTKLHEDHSALFEALGFKATDKVFTKLLEE